MIPFEVDDMVVWTEKGKKEWPNYAGVDRLEVDDLDEADRSLDIRVRFELKGESHTLWINHDMITHASADKDDDAETSNLTMYEKVFGLTPSTHKCPHNKCSTCPAKKYRKPSGGCEPEKWWKSEYTGEFSVSAVTKRPDVNPERKKTTLTGLAGLCEEYNASDYDGLTYIRDQKLCTTPEQKNKLEKLLMLNDLLYTFNSENYSEASYRAQYTQLLKELGVSLDKDGNAYVKEKKKGEEQ